MPNLVFARLADASHRMPHPMRPNTDFPAAGLTVDREDPVWMQLINDGSLVVEEDKPNGQGPQGRPAVAPDGAPAGAPAAVRRRNGA